MKRALCLLALCSLLFAPCSFAADTTGSREDLRSAGTGNKAKVKLHDNGDGTVAEVVSATVSGSGGDASAANQTAVQANAGSNATKAVAIQGIDSGKAVSVSLSSSALTPTATAHTSSGTVSAGCYSLVFIASSDYAGTVLANFPLPASAGVTIPIPAGKTCGAVAYTVTAGTLYSIELR